MRSRGHREAGQRQRSVKCRERNRGVEQAAQAIIHFCRVRCAPQRLHGRAARRGPPQRARKERQLFCNS